ncbi:cysteine hydrolase family protein [Solimicrobium silvestre]|uniref:Amidases related to nicotinamidase n=1 Tax=Solimicrobium silvestre TaxID=2099400 RepID=A0A2S9H3D7_9BURK|nr:cysteine hydrolase family protein [Solimicrobium silvestre]PRC94495.1 Amidases related to nicotinamidase [Solimicrobium silvestre]
MSASAISAKPTKILKRALVVIDVQNEYFSGNLLVEYPDPNVSLKNVGLAMDVAHAAGVPILVVQHTAPQGAPIFQKGQPEWELHDIVKSRKHDHYVEKNLASIFSGTNVATWLKENEIDTLSIIGYMTQNCNASTIYQAMHDGYKVEVLNDATGAVPYSNEAGRATAEEIHRVFNVVFHSNFAAVVSTADWIQTVHADAPIAKGDVFTSNRNAH